MRKIKFLFFIVNLLLFGGLVAQTNPVDVGKAYIQTNFEELNLKLADVDQMILTDHYTSKHNGATHLFFQQSHRDIAVFNATINLTIDKKGKIFVTGNRFVEDLGSKIEKSDIIIEPKTAIMKAAVSVDPEVDRNFEITLKNKKGVNYIFEAFDISDAEITVKPMYVPGKNGQYNLSWNLELDIHKNADYWNMNIDAGNGEVLSKVNYTNYCSFNINSFNHRPHPDKIKKTDSTMAGNSTNSVLGTNAKYKVFPFPGESPNHIEHAVVENPHDTIGSPFGWHDIDGVEGPEFTITQGNNVHAYLDEFDSGTPSGPEPDGGDSLHFILDFDTNAEPNMMKDQAVINLFYTNNMVHDIMYNFGFDEMSGNFQLNNFEKGGLGDDYVFAEAFDGSGTDNANFSTPADGGNGRMQMYLWTSSADLRLEINDPLEIGGLYETGKANFGPDMDVNIVAGKVVLSQDGSSNATLGCNNMVNTEELFGNIAMIDRGFCEFGSKVLHAEQAGAIAALVCNVSGVNGGTGDEIITMAEGAEGPLVTIPSLFLKKSTCDLIRVAMSENKDVNITMGRQQLEGPSQHAASFDNGVITHEYGHGISTRLTGGPSNSSCLYNIDINDDGSADGEQMGEGWSDFYALALTGKAGDSGEDARGIGTYVSGQKVNGRGIRHYPYSTDLNISPVTYDYIKGTNIPHGVGEVWAAAIWDLYWEFVNLYGFDPELKNENAGNFKALLLVTDGLKMQACNPGFLDGRDAILMADEINYGGEHECMIWDVFARRGMGYFAEQGDPFDHRDGKENFEAKPNCVAELKISEQLEKTIVPGENLAIQLKVTNHKPDSVSNVMVIETLPAGLSYVSGSSNVSASESDGKITFELGNMQSQEEIEINYSLASDPGNYSVTTYLDEMEEDNGDWFGLNNIGFETFWELTDIASSTGAFSWYIEESELESDVSLIMLKDAIPVQGESPALSFIHSFNTETITDGGFIEYSLDDGTTWLQFAASDFILNPYSGDLSYSTIAIPGLKAFYGDSEGFIKSYIDLSFLKGQSVVFSFRYGTDDNTIIETEYPGWFVDQIELVELKKYYRDICVRSDENDLACLQSEILIDSKLADPTAEISNANLHLSMGPNPSRHFLNIYIDSPIAEAAEISIYNVHGKLILNEKYQVQEGRQRFELNTSSLTTGSYWVYYTAPSGSRSNKLIISK
jgi:extracellular elastinolytic metalloproteinase